MSDIIYSSFNNTSTTGSFYQAVGSIINWQDPWQEPNDLSLTFQIKRVLSYLKTNGCVIEVEDENKIAAFVENNINLIDYLYGSIIVISKYFGNTKLLLELFSDPEAEDESGNLFLTIETNLSVADALDKLGNIDKEWLIPVIGSDISKFNIDVKII
jgi:hypothetical protein